LIFNNFDFGGNSQLQILGAAWAVNIVLQETLLMLMFYGIEVGCVGPDAAFGFFF
jgi:hypothetical protein